MTEVAMSSQHLMQTFQNQNLSMLSHLSMSCVERIEMFAEHLGMSWPFGKSSCEEDLIVTVLVAYWVNNAYPKVSERSVLSQSKASDCVILALFIICKIVISGILRSDEKHCLHIILQLEISYSQFEGTNGSVRRHLRPAHDPTAGPRTFCWIVIAR